MTNDTLTPATTPTQPAARAGGGLRRMLLYAVWTLRVVLTDWAFIGFILAMPTMMYLFFGNLFGGEEMGGVQVKQHIMVMMATYGGMGSALVAGNLIQTERATGWFRQLMLTALTPTQFFVTRLITSLALILPPTIIVLLVGRIDGVELPWATWLQIIGVALVVLIPFVVMGLVIGLWLKPQAASAATTFVMLGMAMLGGMWVPLDQMPDVMQTIGELLPSYWAAQFSLVQITGADVPMQGVVTLLVWTLALAVVGVLGYRRAIANSKR